MLRNVKLCFLDILSAYTYYLKRQAISPFPGLQNFKKLFDPLFTYKKLHILNKNLQSQGVKVPRWDAVIA
jgi:hypothetical protein